MPKIKDENYYVIHGWMLNQLNLKGVQLQVYAIVYGFSQCEDVEFTGSLSYLCDFTGVSKPTIIKALNDLQEKGLIFKREEKINGVQFNRYSITLPLVKNFNRGSKETLMGLSKNFNGGSKETLPNNIYNNINIKREGEATDVATLSPSEDKIIFGEFANVQLTQVELDKLNKRWSTAQVESEIENLSSYLENNTKKKYKNHYAVLLTWLKKDYPENKQADEQPSKTTLIEEAWCHG